MPAIPSMTLLAWLIIGAIAGFIASEIMGTRENLVLMVILGIVGAIVGGFIASDVFGIAGVTGINITSIIVAVVGAIIVIVIYDFLTDRRLFGRRRYRL